MPTDWAKNPEVIRSMQANITCPDGCPKGTNIQLWVKNGFCSCEAPLVRYRALCDGCGGAWENAVHVLVESRSLVQVDAQEGLDRPAPLSIDEVLDAKLEMAGSDRWWESLVRAQS
jgi:hypothetical protein